MAVDLLNTIAGEIETRLAELRPALAEYEQLRVAAEALDERTGPVQESAARSRATAPRARVAARKPRGRAAARKPRGKAAVSESPASAAVRPPRARTAAGRPAKPKTTRAPRGAAREAILAALGHGSHTVAELAMVTAMSAPNINGNLRRLVVEGAVTKARREGKTAYALTSTSAG